MGPAQWPEGISLKHDVAVPVRVVPQFLQRGFALVEALFPSARVCAFGHMGDGNIHFNVSQPAATDPGPFLERQQAMHDAIHSLVLELGGSISAEHGIGRLKRELMHATKDRVELAMMRAVKQALDPKGIMNPGKVV